MMNDTLQNIATAGNNHHVIPPDTRPAWPDGQERAWLHFKSRLERWEPLKLTSSELMRYPKLTEKLRSLPDFPLLKRVYPLDLPDSAHIRRGHYDDFVRYCFNRFQEEWAALNQQVSQWVSEYGQQREIPIINSININTHGGIERCVINGLPWDFPVAAAHAGQCTRCLDLYQIFSIDRQWDIQIEDAILGSPLLALIIHNDAEGHKGRLIWYNLETRKQGSLSDAVRYPHHQK